MFILTLLLIYLCVLHNLTLGCLRSLEGHTAAVNAVCFAQPYRATEEQKRLTEGIQVVDQGR